jgi:hypothetical protein
VCCWEPMKERSTDRVRLRFVRGHGRWAWPVADGLLGEPVVEEGRFGKERVLFEVVRVA